MMDRRQFLKANTAALLGVAAARQVQRPNIVVLMADDLGYADLSCFGSAHIRTPVLDRLAQEGLKLTDFYAAAPNCSPSRAAMLTGRFPARVGLYSYIDPDSPMHLPAEEVTSATVLRRNGYQTAHVGKWHLCSDLQTDRYPGPGAHGFTHWLATENNAEPSHHNPVNFVLEGEALGEIEGYACQIVADEAIRWLQQERDPDQPFFLNLWFHEPHVEVAAPPELLARHQGHEEAAYFACVENMDHAIGRVLATLDRLGLRDNTFVLFTSDNGSYRAASNGKFRARKSFVWEGGIRAPTLLRWPGRIRPGSVSDVPGSGVDVLPTLCAVAGAELPAGRKLDGVSLVPLFRGAPVQRAAPLFWFFYRTDPACALREGKWSLVGYLDEPVPPGHSFRPSHMQYLRRARPNRFELFDLDEDPEQTQDVSAAYPDRFEALQRQMAALHAEVIRDGPVWFQ